MAHENKLLKDTEEKLLVELKNTHSSIQALHDEERFSIQAEGAVKVEEENASLRRSLTQREEELEAANEHMQNLKVSHDALTVSYEQISAELGTAIAKHDVELQRVNDKLNVALAAEPRVDTALVACQEAANARIASELAKMEEQTKDAVTCAEEETRALVRCEMEAKLEAKLEATEKRNASTERKLNDELERARRERDDAQALARKYAARARVADDFVAATVAPTVTTESSAAESVDADSRDTDDEAALNYKNHLYTLDMHKKAVHDDPHSTRKMMRTAAVVRECRDVRNAMVSGKTVPSCCQATADRDTGLICCSQRSLTNESVSMNTKAYPMIGAPFAEDDMGGRKLVNIVHTGEQQDHTDSEMTATQQNRMNALIIASKDDITKSLAFNSLVHKLNAGVISEIRVDATGKSMAYTATTGD
jgi:hypothetical protein